MVSYLLVLIERDHDVPSGLVLKLQQLRPIFRYHDGDTLSW